MNNRVNNRNNSRIFDCKIKYYSKYRSKRLTNEFNCAIMTKKGRDVS